MFKVGYTQGVYDMLHIGHLNLLRNAKMQCEKLIVGVNADELVQEYKHKTPLIPTEERVQIISAIRWVDEAHVATTLDKIEALKKHHFDVIFIGDDWKGSERWLQAERELAEFGVKVVYLPHTEGISSTMLHQKMMEENK